MGIEPIEKGVRVEYVSTQARPSLRLFNEIWCSAPVAPRTRADLLLHPDGKWPQDLSFRGSELQILGVSIRLGVTDCHPPKIRRDGRWAPPDIDFAAWQAGLRIARIAYHEEARFLLRGRADSLVIQEARDATGP